MTVLLYLAILSLLGIATKMERSGIIINKTIIIGFIAELAFIILFFSDSIGKIGKISMATADGIWIACGVIGLLTSIINFIRRTNWIVSSLVFIISIFILMLYVFGLYLDNM